MLKKALFGLIVVASMIPVGKGRRVTAQSPTGIPAVDSAAVARSAWSKAMRAFRANDLPSARQEVEHAAAAWPSQPTYLWARAILAARGRDTAALMSALGDYAQLGLGRDLRADTTFAVYADRPWFARLASAHDANRAVIARSTVRMNLTDSTLYPEGVDFDPRSGRYYIGSIRHRTVVEASPDGKQRELLTRDARGNGAVLGVRVDAKHGVVWATMTGIPQMEGYTPQDSTIAALVRIRISDGAIEKRYDFSASVPHVLGDLAIGPNGDVFVSDSRDPAVYRLRPGNDSLEIVRNPLFRSLQGLAPTPDGRFVYLADYSHGMLRLDLADNSVVRLEDPPHATTLGNDGIAFFNGAIIAVQNGVAPSRIMRFELDREGKRIIAASVLDRNWKIADEPTIGTVVGDEFVYVANSQSEKYNDDGSRKTNIPLTAPVLLAVPLNH